MNNLELEKILNDKLSASLIKDYCPNGLQVEGKAEIRKVITGVTASQALIEQAVEKGADALLVHHGYFWKGEPEPIRGMKGNRIRTLMRHDINLLAYHLPLDIHPQLGNNAQLANLLDIEVEGGLEGHGQSVAMFGRLRQAMSAEAFADKITQFYHVSHCILHQNVDNALKRLAGVLAVGKILLNWPLSGGWMLIFLEKFQSALPTARVKWGFTTFRLGIMLPNGMASKP